MRRFVTFAASTLFLVAAATGAARLAATAPTYTVEDLGTTPDGFAPTGVTGINDNGQVSGTVNTPGGQRPVRFTTGFGFEYLAGVDAAVGVGNAINASGEVAGYSMAPGAQRAFRAGIGSATFVDPEPGGTITLGWAINKDGVVAGYGNTPSGFRAYRAAANTPEVLTPLPNGTTTLGFGINDLGQVTGSSLVAGVQHAFRANPDGTVDDIGAGAPGASIGTAIAANGDVVGRFITISGVFHAFRYTDHIADIDTLGTTNSNATAVSGTRVVGTFTAADGTSHPFVYTAADGMVDLNDRLPADSGWMLSTATGVNSTGQITGMGLLNGVPRAYRLTPNKPPDTTAPVISSLTASPSSITPPDGRTVTVTVSVSATDDSGDAPTCKLASISGPGSSPVDFNVTSDTTGTVRAVGGSTYTFTETCSDAAGNSASSTVAVVVPPDTTPPVFSSVSATPSVITPADLRTVTVTMAAAATDDSGATPVCKLGSIAGPGTSGVDYAVSGANTGTVRAVGGRTYTFNEVCTDGAGNAATAAVPVYVPPDTTAPTITSLSASPSSIWPPDNAMVPVTVSVTATDDADPAPACSLASITGPGVDADHVVTGQFTGSVRAVGGRTYTFVVGCSDFTGNRSQSAVPVTVVPDTTAPAITSMSVAPATIWPANNKMVPVTVSATAEDDVDPSPVCKLSSVTSNGGSSADAMIAGAFTALVRASKNNDGSIRVYTLTVTCSDNAGNASDSTISVAIVKDGPARLTKGPSTVPPTTRLVRGYAIHRPGFAKAWARGHDRDRDRDGDRDRSRR